MTDFLEQVIAERRADVERARRSTPSIDVAVRPRPRGRALDQLAWALRIRRNSGRLAVIAEVKRTSPALGVLRAEVDPVAQALAYADAGATAISVLTEPRHWGGAIEDLVAVAEAVDIPVLRKDVIVDTYQLDEAFAAGADAVLLIAEALDPATLHRLVAHARELGIGVFVEAHEPAAFSYALSCGATVVGVNARNLRRPTEIDIGRVRQLHSFVRPDQFLVAESGIASVDDARMLPARVDAVLVGTALMRADDPAPLIRGLSAIRRTVHA